MVMAAGDWNSALGGLARTNYLASRAEKELIYGYNAMNKAYSKIMTCCQFMYPNIIIPPVIPPIVNNNDTTYDVICDSNSVCNCDSDSDCGCDCDYDDANIIVGGLVLTTIISVVSVAFLIGMSICICYMCHKMRNQPKYVAVNDRAMSEIAVRQ